MKDERPDFASLRGSKLFITIVSNAAGSGAKATTFCPKFVNMKTRGKAVAIGPLEYCGSGIPFNLTRGGTL